MRAALRNLSDCNDKFIQLLEGADMPDEVPRAQMYYVMAENDSSEVLRLAEHRVSVSCVLNLSSSQLEGEVKLEDAVSQSKYKEVLFHSRVQCTIKGCGQKGGFNGACTGPE